MKMRSKISMISLSVLMLIASVAVFRTHLPEAAASDQKIDCLKCHAKLKSGKVVHPALEMGCTACHTGIDVKTVPHKKTNKIAKGLSAAPPELCYGCHDQGMFTKKDVHPAIDMGGCTGCHDPHSSNNEKMLKKTPPDLCFTCHDKPMFSKKTVHPPVAAGKCLSCHSPHSSDQMALLLKAPVEVCLGCHPDIPNAPHAAAVFSATSHPLGLPKIVKKTETVKKGDKEETKVVEVKEPAPMNPAQPEKVFYCGSCHNPHSTPVPYLFRFGATSTMDLCSHCHKR